MFYNYWYQLNNKTHQALKMSAIKNISLYIPHVFANYSKEDIARVFNDFIGSVKTIDLVVKRGKDGKTFNAAYIHFRSWHNTVATQNFQDRVLDPNQEARIVYDDPWYWICLENKSRKVAPHQRKLRLDIGEQSTIATTDAGILTPVKAKKNIQTPNAPVKSARPLEFTNAEIEELEAAFEAHQATVEREDQYLVSVDSRYIQILENENVALRNSVANLETRIAGGYC